MAAGSSLPPQSNARLVVTVAVVAVVALVAVMTLVAVTLTAMVALMAVPVMTLVAVMTIVAVAVVTPVVGGVAGALAAGLTPLAVHADMAEGAVDVGTDRAADDAEATEGGAGAHREPAEREHPRDQHGDRPASQRPL
jgi:hypothetical protein